MVKTVSMMALGVVSTSIGWSAVAAPLASDTFSYADGVITTVSGGTWVNHSAGNGTNSVVSGQYVMDDNVTGDVNIGFGEISSGTIYIGFDLTVSSADAPTSTNGQYFAHLSQANDPRTSLTNFVSPIYLAAGSQTGSFKIGHSGSVAGSPTYFANEFNLDQTYRLVLEVEAGTGTKNTKLFVDPTSLGDASVAGTYAGIGFVEVLAFRGVGTSDGDKTIDNLNIATTFAEVVPEPASLVLLGLGGLCLVGRRGDR